LAGTALREADIELPFSSDSKWVPGEFNRLPTSPAELQNYLGKQGFNETTEGDESKFVAISKDEFDDTDTITIKERADGTLAQEEETFAPGPSQPLSAESMTVLFNEDGSQLGIIQAYGDGDAWFNTHMLDPTHLANFDESAVDAFTQDVERDAFHGDATPSASPDVLSYEPEFNSGYDFNSGDFDVTSAPFDVSSADSYTFNPDVTPTNVSNGYDPSWVNDWYYNDWAMSSFDGWSSDDSWDPVVLDLDGSGINITNRTDSPVYFDVDGDGYKEKTAWAGPSDGLLVIDLAANGAAGADGQINQAKEIAFAQWTGDPNDTDLQALRTVFDTNGDGRLTSADARWSEFRVWKDANQNGTVEAGELQTLAQAGVTQVNLTSDGNQYLLPDGSKINGTASFVANGVTRSLADAGLAYDTSGFQRVATSQGFNYVSEDGTTKQFIDTRVYVPPGWTTPAYNAASSTVYLNYGTPDATHQYVDGYLAGQGDDAVWAYGSKAVTIYGDLGNDDLEGSDGNDVIDGGPGADYLLGEGGDDTIYFDSNDVIADDDPHAPAPTRFAIDGGTGYDTAIYTSTSGVTVNLAYLNMEGFIGNNGNDVVSAVGIQTGTQASPGAPVGAYIDGRAGDDQITGSAQGDILVGGLGNDTIHGGDGADLITGDSGNDILYAEAGNDNVMAGDGNDWVSGGAGNNKIDGGAGVDTVDYSGWLSSQITVTKNADSTATVQRADGTDRLSDVEWLQFADKRQWIGTGDTYGFNFKLTDATVSTDSSGHVVIDGPDGSHASLTGINHYIFTDGTVNERLGDPLVDDLFYYSTNHDVWNAHVDATAHYEANGWHEGRNPDAYFSTSGYLSANPDVAAAGIDPMLHYEQYGWKEGRNPSPAFDTNAYLQHNPDVAEANANPLVQFLASGQQTGLYHAYAVGSA
jgi:Ca2+-binding RTX toxin-like protein